MWFIVLFFTMLSIVLICSIVLCSILHKRDQAETTAKNNKLTDDIGALAGHQSSYSEEAILHVLAWPENEAEIVQRAARRLDQELLQLHKAAEGLVLDCKAKDYDKERVKDTRKTFRALTKSIKEHQQLIAATSPSALDECRVRIEGQLATAQLAGVVSGTANDLESVSQELAQLRLPTVTPLALYTGLRGIEQRLAKVPSSVKELGPTNALMSAGPLWSLDKSSKIKERPTKSAKTTISGFDNERRIETLRNGEILDLRGSSNAVRVMNVEGIVAIIVAGFDNRLFLPELDSDSEIKLSGSSNTVRINGTFTGNKLCLSGFDNKIIDSRGRLARN